MPPCMLKPFRMSVGFESSQNLVPSPRLNMVLHAFEDRVDNLRGEAALDAHVRARGRAELDAHPALGGGGRFRLPTGDGG